MFRSMTAKTLLVIVLASAIGAAACAQAAPKKKLIQFGWDMKSPAYLQESIGDLQHLPFDGLTVRDTRFCYTFYNEPISEADVQKTIEIVKSIPWGKFTDNFMYVTAADVTDWFDDAAWAEDSKILTNARTVARVARAGGFKGILFDPEFTYWGQPSGTWKYAAQAHKNKKTFAEYEAMARKRGAQYMETLQEEYPDLVVLTLFMVSDPRMFKEARKEADPVKRSKLIEPEYYGLWPAVIHGMLDAAEGKTIIIDGNEYGYYIRSPEAYADAVKMMHEGVKLMFDPKVWPKYQKHVQAGHAIYMDTVCNLLPFRLTAST